MYRAVTFAALRRGIDPDEVEPVGELAEDLDLDVVDAAVTVDGVDATIEIRGPEVTRAPSASWPPTRGSGRRCATASGSGPTQHGGGVIEGRDIGTVVFPDAELKVYLDRLRGRAGRRAVTRRSPTSTTRDQGDDRRPRRPRPGRADSPLREADDAIVIDTSDLGVDEIVDRIVALLDPGPATDPG